MNELPTIPDHMRRRIADDLAAYNSARQSAKDERNEIDRQESRATAITEAVTVAQATAKGIQETAHAQIATIVGQSLDAVFGSEAYEFKIVFDEKKGKTEARLVFVREGEEIDPMTAAGGGVLDVASFALRLSCLLMSQPPLRRLIVADEPFKHLSRDHVDRVGKLLLLLSEKLGIQILMVTHSEPLAVGKIVQL